jgi:cytochrome c553
MNRWLLALPPALACLLSLAPSASEGSGADPALALRSGSSPIDFERDVRPLLARCVQCHGPSKAQAGLRLDSRAAAIAELSSGNRALVPGKPDESELLRRVSDAGSRRRMPPRGEMLKAGQVETLRAWIAAGADWPAHWAYRPLTKPTPPQPPARLREQARTPIDLFILDKLAALGLSPSPEADRRTLVRRLTLDLTGLPPTPEEMEAALADNSPEWYEKVVDRLLASPRHGERMARFWMDLVHFAETHGHDQDRPRDNAWPYRDYLIRSFNQDKPYVRFVTEQIAGDVLFPDDPWATVATGFLAAGPWDESSLRDIREDSIDRQIGRYLDRDDIVTTVAATFVSTTVHCARCHDHKFDPVTQDDYYALQAVFAATDKANRPYDADPQIAARRRQLLERTARLSKVQDPPDARLLEETAQAEVAAWERLVGQAAEPWHVLEPAEAKSAEGATLTRLPDGSLLSEGKRPEKDTYTIVAHTDLQSITGVRLEVLTDDRLPHKGPGRQDNGNFHLNEFVVTAAPRSEAAAAKPIAFAGAKADFEQQGWTIAQAIDGNAATAWGIYPQVGQPHRAVFRLKQPLHHDGGTTLTVKLQQTHGGGHLIGRLRLAVTASSRPDSDTLPAAIATALKVAASERTPRQRAELAAYVVGEKLKAELAALPARQLVFCGTSTFEPDRTFRPTGTPRPVHILKRGDIRSPAKLAQPGTLSCLSGLPGRFALENATDEGSRRAALARWLADPRNGLTWRSIANRMWQIHFGRGLVDTPNDFGLMGTAPTHRELLDWLAIALQEDGGSLKKLHRRIVSSTVYRQSCNHRSDHAAIDADNRYLWRMNRRRLAAEEIHDCLLSFSGKIDLTMGGPSVKQFHMSPGIHVTPNVDYVNFDADAPANYRRSVYRFLFRTLPDPFMETLDCPDGAQLAPARSASVTALQALAMRNDKFVVRQSEHIAARVSQSGAEKRVEALHQLVLGRSPTAREERAVAAYANKHGLANACRVLLNSNEFMFVD